MFKFRISSPGSNAVNKTGQNNMIKHYQLLYMDRLQLIRILLYLPVSMTPPHFPTPREPTAVTIFCNPSNFPLVRHSYQYIFIMILILHEHPYRCDNNGDFSNILSTSWNFDSLINIRTTSLQSYNFRQSNRRRSPLALSYMQCISINFHLLTSNVTESRSFVLSLQLVLRQLKYVHTVWMSTLDIQNSACESIFCDENGHFSTGRRKLNMSNFCDELTVCFHRGAVL
jgi:hypothetical protein